MLTITCYYDIYCYESFYYLNIILNLNENRKLIMIFIYISFKQKLLYFIEKIIYPHHK